MVRRLQLEPIPANAWTQLLKAARLFARYLEIERTYDAGDCVPTRTLSTLKRDVRAWLKQLPPKQLPPKQVAPARRKAKRFRHDPALGDVSPPPPLRPRRKRAKRKR